MRRGEGGKRRRWWRPDGWRSLAKTFPDAGDGRVSFSQEGEDLVLAAVMERLGLDLGAGGFYVDVGAHHPTRFSNTHFFYKAGWNGVNVDPNPGLEELFERERPGDVYLNLAVGGESGTADFYVYNEPALNGIDNDRRIELEKTQYKLIRIDEVRVETLAKILSDHGTGLFRSPSFANIDVEGYEESVLSGNDWARYLFDFLLLEERVRSLPELFAGRCHRKLLDLGYTCCAYTGRTAVYAQDSLFAQT